MMKLILTIQFILLSAFLSGCSGVQTFPGSARAGDTTAVMAGWKHNFSRDEIMVTITPSVGVPVVYEPGDPAVRAVVNLYPDPLSSLLVSSETGQDLTAFAQLYASQVNLNFTGGDKDWWQTAVFVDLPSVIAEGAASIDITSVSGETHSSVLQIINGDGQAETFEAELNGPLLSHQLAALERVGHSAVLFSGSTLPFAIQVKLSHDPDAENGGAGMAHVVNTRGDLKSTSWSDDGMNMTVLITPSTSQSLSDFVDFKFYIAGGITGLLVSDIQAVDFNGNPVSGVSVSIENN